MTQIGAHLMEKTLQLFQGNSPCFSWLNKETVWPLRYLDTFPLRSPSTGSELTSVGKRKQLSNHCRGDSSICLLVNKKVIFCISNSKHESLFTRNCSRRREKRDITGVPRLNLYQENLGVENLMDYFCTRK